MTQFIKNSNTFQFDDKVFVLVWEFVLKNSIRKKKHFNNYL